MPWHFDSFHTRSAASMECNTNSHLRKTLQTQVQIQARLENLLSQAAVAHCQCATLFHQSCQMSLVSKLLTQTQHFIHRSSQSPFSVLVVETMCGFTHVTSVLAMRQNGTACEQT